MNKVKETNKKAVLIATTLKVDDKAKTFVRFALLYYNQTNFPEHIKCRLINPSKTEIGKIGEVILEI